MIPNNIPEWIIKYPRPENRENDKYQDIINNLFSDCSIDCLKQYIITKSEASDKLDEMGINKNSTLYKYYSNYIGVDSSNRKSADLLSTLEEIYEDYKNPFWQEQYPNIQDRYLRISSIEGEHSYFYDKETDAVYDVDWNQMDDLVSGKLKPQWKSFYDFLEWYYGEDEE